MRLRFMTRSGAIDEITVERLLEVDGVPYRPADEGTTIERLSHLEGRVAAIEAIFTKLETPDSPETLAKGQ